MKKVLIAIIFGLIPLTIHAQSVDCSVGPTGLCLVKVTVKIVENADGTKSKETICEWGECKKKDNKENEQVQN